MSAASSRLIAAQEQFTTHLAAVEGAARWAFRRRRLRRQDYEEALAEAVAAAWGAWVGLMARGRDPLEVGVHGIANNAIRYVRNGRRVANRSGGRGAMDIHHRRAQKVGGFRVVSYDPGPTPSTGSESAAWREWLVGDKRVSPADEAAFRLDFAAWLAGLPRRRRRTAELLAEGRGTLEVAEQLGITPAAISQSRSWLRSSWQQFQGEFPSASD